MAENGDKERLRQLERRADKMDDALDAQSLACSTSRIDFADRLGRIETQLEQLTSVVREKTVGSAKVRAARITGIAGIVAAIAAAVIAVLV